MIFGIDEWIYYRYLPSPSIKKKKKVVLIASTVPVFLKLTPDEPLTTESFRANFESTARWAAFPLCHSLTQQILISKSSSDNCI